MSDLRSHRAGYSGRQLLDRMIATEAMVADLRRNGHLAAWLGAQWFLSSLDREGWAG